jgi:hypothetical protein
MSEQQFDFTVKVRVNVCGGADEARAIAEQLAEMALRYKSIGAEQAAVVEISEVAE